MNTRLDEESSVTGEAGCISQTSSVFELAEEQQMVKDMCRDFGEKVLKEQAVEIDKTHRFPMETTKKLGELGMMGIVYPEEYNGSGMDYVSYSIAILFEESQKTRKGLMSFPIVVLPPYNVILLRPNSR